MGIAPWASPDPDRAALDDPFAEFAALEPEMYSDALDRSTVARLGVMCTLGQEWSGFGAAADRRYVALNRPSDYSESVWDAVVESAANRLVRRNGFWIVHAAVVHALEREGWLTYEQVAALVTGSPDAAPPSGTAAVPNVATSARRPAAYVAKVASAAVGGLRDHPGGPPI